MLKPDVTDSTFQLQGRTDLAWDSDGNPQRATVFVAFAVKDSHAARVHVEMTEDRQRKPL